MSGFTPGPWEVLNNSWEFTTIYDAKRQTVCELRVNVEDDRDEVPEHIQKEHDANASLIAASPELYEALGRAAFHANLRGWATNEDHELAEVYRQMKAALRKAEGR